LKTNGWDIVKLNRDLHNSEYTKENITTEYEDYYSSKGIKIKMLVAIPPVSD
jgi:tRNA (guanine-N7-)-methyltransferase